MLVDFSVVEGIETQVISEFIKKDALKKYRLYVYLLILDPPNHKFHVYTKSDMFYWNDWFTKSRKDKRGRRYPKGYIELEF